MPGCANTTQTMTARRLPSDNLVLIFGRMCGNFTNSGFLEFDGVAFDAVGLSD